MTLIEKLESSAKWEIVVNIACFAFFCRAAPAHAYTDSNETGKFSHSNCSAGLSNVLQPGCKKPYKIALGKRGKLRTSNYAPKRMIYLD